jgi:hypothetical protein
MHSVATKASNRIQFLYILVYISFLFIFAQDDKTKHFSFKLPTEIKQFSFNLTTEIHDLVITAKLNFNFNLLILTNNLCLATFTTKLEYTVQSVVNMNFI